MIYKLNLWIFLFAHIIGHAQQEVIFEKNMQTSGNLTIGQDLSQDSLAGMIRWDSVSMTFQGFNGSKWITFTSPSPSVGTDTLEVGDRYGGGIVFFIVGDHGLIVTDFDLGLPSNIVVQNINWGSIGTNTNAKSVTDGAANTALIVSTILNADDGKYTAKVCDDFVLGGFDDWYLPSLVEFEIMNEVIGFGAASPLTNLANLNGGFYWTSTETDSQQARSYSPSNSSFLSSFKSLKLFVRAIRAY